MTLEVYISRLLGSYHGDGSVSYCCFVAFVCIHIWQLIYSNLMLLSCHHFLKTKQQIFCCILRIVYVNVTQVFFQYQVNIQFQLIFFIFIIMSVI